MNRTGLLIEQTMFPDDLQMILNEASQGIDDRTHEVGSWSEYVASFLEYLEFHAMANDPHHPEQFELMISRLRDMIISRLKNGFWG
jgi:hypothetical protein